MTETADHDVQAAFAATLVDEWVRCGVGHAVVCPGSRSTPLAVALAAHPDMAVHVRLDERSAAFTALGIGMATGRPGLVLTTSGTAAVELHPAVVEADLAGVPLLACTADRPPELRDVGAPQTIDQTHLYGRAVRWFTDPGVPSAATRSTWRSLAARAVIEATAGPRGPGPVHLNLPFREPLLGEPSLGGVPPGRAGGASWHSLVAAPTPPPAAVVEELAAAGRRGERGLVLAGGGCGDPDAVLALAEGLGWPVLADPRSGVRRPHHHVVAAADALGRSYAFVAAHQPEVVVTLGAPWASKVVNAMTSSAVAAGARLVVVDPWGRWTDPDRTVATLVRCDPSELCRAVSAALGDGPRPATEEAERWLDGWVAAEAAAQRVLAAELDTGLAGAAGGLSEPWLARRLLESVPADATVLVSSSMPVRDVEAFAAPRLDPPAVVANRGANGIDGVLSTGVGLALATAGPVVALVGDLAFLHDVSALVGSVGSEVSATVVVADNRGGGIFSFLPPARALDAAAFEALFGTPQAPDVADVAAGFGLPVDDLGSEDGPDAFATVLARHLTLATLSVVRVRLPGRSTNVADHARLNQLLVEAIDRTLRRGRGQQGRGS